MDVHNPDEFVSTDLAEYMDSARIALSVSSCVADDHPLLYVNEAFCALTGYQFEESVGRNCRFLQREVRNQTARDSIHRFLAGEGDNWLACPLINFTADGSPFVNLLYMSQIRSSDNRSCYIFASQFDASSKHIDMLNDYDQDLAKAIQAVSDIAGNHDMLMEQSQVTLARTARSIAETKLAIRQLSGMSY